MADARQSSATATPSPRARGRWIVAALILFVVASVVAFTQAPHPRLEGRGVMDSLLYPIERNPGDRLARVDTNLYNVTMSADGQRAVAVGQSGVILNSSNGGQSWAAQTSGTANTLRGVSLSSDGQRAVAVGDNGVILTSSNGGQSWAAQTSGTPNLLLSVSPSSDGQRAVAVGLGGKILTSSNGGQSWATQSSGTSNRLFGVSLSSDGQRAIAVGDGGVILTSSNGGQSWAMQASGRTDGLSAVALSADGQRVIAVGQGGVILTSSNGGQSWAAQTSGTINMLDSVSMSLDGKHAVAVGDDGVILNSNDGGTSWSVTESGTTAALGGVSLSGDGQRAVALGYGGVILTSGDSGTNWAEQAIATTETLSRVLLSANGQSVLAVGNSGQILSSRDGGTSWAVQASSTTKDLTDVALSADGQRAVALGEDGVILTSGNGGQSWAAQTSGVTDALFSVSLSRDGQRAVAVGEGGVILASSDGGQSWAAQTSGTTDSLYGVSMSGDGKSAVAVGSRGGIAVSTFGQSAVVAGIGGVILTSSNSGRTWSQRSLPRTSDYVRYPAPWYYLALLLCGAFLFRAFSGTAQPPQSGAAAMAASDSPTLSLDQDRLEFAPLARGISRFLRNANTDPPLTLAITGEWGSGKSSLMGQVCADLRANHWRPVWFNAWHHQNEEQLLAALLVAIREHGAPPLTAPAGWAFRLRLLLIRATQRKISTLLVVTVTSLIITFLADHPNGSEWHGLAAKLAPLLTGEFGATELSALSSILPVLGSAGVFYAIGRTIKAFGVDPAILLSSTMAKFRLKDASAQTSFRMRFAEQFGEVTQALAHPMVIVIDDLDRCKPETVLDVMEAVNFLTSSGKCFVIFGMATQRVQAALALSFKEIAGELAQFDDAGDERQRRRDYARDYLEKLINIEILVPDRTDLPPSQLLEARAAAARDPLAEWLAEAKRWALLLPLGAAVALGVWLSSLIGLPDVKAPDAPKETATKNAPTSAPAAPVQPSGAQTAPPAPAAPVPANQAPVIVPGDDSGISLLWLAGALASLLLAGAALMLRWYQRQKLVVQDTQAFNDAMRIWSPIATFTRNSPRSIKRFGNRIRYLAMLQQGEQLDAPPVAQQLTSRLSTALRGLWARIRQRPAEPDAAPPPDQNDSERALSEHRVVALGAMHAHFGAEWRSMFENPTPSEVYALFSDEGDGFHDKYMDAVTGYRSIPGASWPPSTEELDAFERSLKGVRLPGDGRTFDAAPPASSASAAVAPTPVDSPSDAGTTKARPRARPKS